MWFAIYCLALVMLSSGSATAAVVVNGKVADETGVAVASTRIEFRGAPADPVTASAVTDLSGAFTVRLPSAGEYHVRAARPGFFVYNGSSAFAEGTNQLLLTMNHLEEFIQSVDVAYSPPAIDTEQTAEQKQIHSAEILAVPYPASQDLRNALPLIPGVVQDNSGRLHFNGGDTGQTNFTLDGFNIADPVTGRFEARLNIESVRSVEVEGARYSASRDRGSAGTVDIQTAMGDDRWRFGLTNFFPSFSTQSSFHFNKWTPRISVSGPIARGRAWFYNGFDAFYDVDTIPELPDGQNRTRALNTSNLTRLQVNLTPGNILTGSVLLNYAGENRDGLSFLTPVETTLSRRQTLHFYSVKDQIYLPGGALFEFGFALNRGYGRDRPQGHETLDISPFGRSGNYFLDMTRHSGREQWNFHSTLPAFQAFGAHQIRFGADAQNSSFTTFADRHDYRILREDLTVARYVTFQGDGSSRKSGLRLGEYVQDRWAPAPGILIETGLRVDWDNIIDGAVLSPRLSIAYAPRWTADTKLAAGIGIFYDAPSLGIFGRQDQVSLMTFYDELGQVRLGPLETAFDVENRDLAAPRYRILSFSLERKLPLSIYGKASYMGKLGRRNFTFVAEPSEAAQAPFRGGLYRLRNWRNDRYDAFELTFRRTFGRFEWSGGYTRSSARTDAVVDYSLENPIFAEQAPGPLPWDTPSRFMTWGWAPLPKRLLPRALAFLTRNTDVAYLAEYRTGFPFGVVNEDGFQVGKPNERRLPSYFSINLHFERRFRFLRYQWAWRFGLNNLTNSGNPNIVNNNIDSSAFLTYGRGQQRAFNVRLRFLGRR